ncbi:ATP-binding cassette domain-containing protein [Maioricimonas rarisocia]|uniref:ATP-binding cassette domain-containing protein n=1 Tax=Maioricimonas rarisocia TaxID=2528026 RepID=UPI0011A3148C|nr:ATP-binding cassette domain-containing protein [Maioricimonas rarisocia]
MRVSVAYDFLPRRPGTRAAAVMSHFGIGFEQMRHVVAEDLELPLAPGQVVLFTGASGSGKSSLMRAVVGQIRGDEACGDVSDDRPRVIVLDELQLPDATLVESLPGSVADAMRLLSACGLAEAHLMLRTPEELSDGQRYRFRLALGLSHRPAWLVADEFTATLDRLLAKVIAFNVRRLSRRTETGFLLATTHEDVAGDLAPDLHVHCRLDGRIDVIQQEAEGPCPRRTVSSHSSTSSGSAARPDPTGRTSLGGITAATASESCDSARCCGTVSSRSASACSHRPRSRSHHGTDSSGAAVAGARRRSGQ